jgi:hypothetical protein
VICEKFVILQVGELKIFVVITNDLTSVKLHIRLRVRVRKSFHNSLVRTTLVQYCVILCLMTSRICH